MGRRFWLELLLAVLALGPLCADRYGSSLSDIVRALLFSDDELVQSLVWNLWMPRILLVNISGAALAVSGVVYQTIFRNPPASGDVTGASSGCSLGAVFAILFYQGSWFIELCAFLTGMLLVILTFLFVSRVRGNRILDLVVVGLIPQAVATSLMVMMKLYADPATQLVNMEYWLMDGFPDASWSAVLLTLVLCIFGMNGLYLLRWQIQPLSLGEEAFTLGVNVKLIRWVSLLLAILLISSVISVVGIASWVSLSIPHIIRITCRKPTSQTTGITAVSGAIFLLLCDTLVRTPMAIEIPISIPTSLFDILVLVVLLVKGRLRS